MSNRLIGTLQHNGQNVILTTDQVLHEPSDMTLAEMIDDGELQSGNGNGANPSTPARAVYGASIDMNNSNPNTSVTYTDQATGMVKGSPLWDGMALFRDIRPVLFQNGRVVGYLNPNNYGQWDAATNAEKGITGLPATPDITSGNGGDVMIEIPKIGWRIITTGNTLTCQITNDPNLGSQGFRYFAHTRASEGDRNFLYIGAYQGHVLSNRLRSLSGRVPTGSMTIGNFRNNAQANGAGYSLGMFFAYTLVQLLYLIRFGNLNSQGTLGQGVTSGSAPINTGSTNTRGMNWGSQNTRESVKCMGIEDFWGNMWDRVDGMTIDASWNFLTAFQNFNDTGAGYTNRGNVGGSLSGFLTRPQGTNEMGFLGRVVGGSDSTHFTDWSNLSSGSSGFFGGSWVNGSRAGVFRWSWSTWTNAGSNRGGRLMFL